MSLGRAPVAVRFFVAALGCCLSVSVAHAQVIRCTDAVSGKVTYTDGSCDTGQRSTQVQARKTEQALAAEREEAAEALERKRERQQAQAEADQRQLERETLQAQRQAQRDAQSRQTASPADYANSRACADARRALNAAAGSLARTPEEQASRVDAAQQQMDFACLGPDAYVRAQANRPNYPPVIVVQQPVWPHHNRPRPPHAERPRAPYIKECTSFTCTDNNGKRYPRTGRGSFGEP